jgi:broad specificity phosphatase PhoE
MSADHLHFVRHGQVFNPDGVIYERIEGFGLSEMGWKIATIAAEKSQQMNITRVISSPLQRARESVKPWLDNTGHDLEVDPRVIENWNRLKGLRPGVRSLAKKPWKRDLGFD